MNNHNGHQGALPAVPNYDVGGYTEENEYAYISEVLPPSQPHPQLYGTKDNVSSGSNAINGVFINCNDDVHIRPSTTGGPPSGNNSNSNTPQRHMLQTFSNPGAQLVEDPTLSSSPRHESISLPRSKNTTPSHQQTPIKNTVLPRLLAHECALTVKTEPQPGYGATHVNHQVVCSEDPDHRCQVPAYYELESQQQHGGHRLNYTPSPSHVPANNMPKMYAVQRHQ